MKRKDYLNSPKRKRKKEIFTAVFKSDTHTEWHQLPESTLETRRHTENSGFESCLNNASR